MNEEVAVILITGFFVMAAYILYLKLFRIRRLQKKIDQHVDQALAAARAMPRPSIDGDQHNQLASVQRRLAVLERIAVEKEHTLVREIDELRVAGR